MLNIFQLADNDQSVAYLGQIFGNMGVALAGSGSSILGNMFRTFNTFLLVVGAFFIVYITIVGVMTAAQEGEFMKKWNSLWTPIRIVLGIVALFPTASGYCAIQVVIMWLIIQGVGAADSVWKTTVDYVAKGAVKTDRPIDESNNPATAGIPPSLQNLFANLVCQSIIGKYKAENPKQIGNAEFVAHSELTPTGYKFGPDGKCGSVSWDASAVGVALQGAYSTLVPVYEMLANEYVNSIINDKNCWDTDTTECQKSSSCLFGKYSSYKGGLGACSIHDSQKSLANVTSYGGSNFISDTMQLLAGYANNFAANQAVIEQQLKQKSSGSLVSNAIDSNYQNAQNQGWIFAGAYYYYMAYRGNQNQSNYAQFYKAFNVSQADLVNLNLGEVPPSYLVSSFYCGQYEPGNCSSSTSSGALGLVKKAQEDSLNKGGGNAITFQGGFKAGGGGGGPSTDALDGVSQLTIRTWINNLTGSVGGNDNPIVTLQYFGKSCLIAAEVLFWIFFGITIALGIASTTVVALGFTVNPLEGVSKAMLSFFMPVVFGVIGYLIIIGGLLGIYVPLLPFVLFTFGAIGWFIAVIEAIVAGPLMALGILSPGGQHEILGRAEPAVMILLNTILRPTLMVFGMILAMLLSYVVMYLINGSFLGVVTSINRGTGMGLLEAFLFIMAYAGLVITALNKCFALIHEVPTKVLRFIGGHAEGYGEEQAAGQVQGKVSAGGQAATGAGKGAVSAAGGAARAGGAAQKAYGKYVEGEKQAHQAKVAGKKSGGGEEKKQ